jgi:hypothetical protein
MTYMTCTLGNIDLKAAQVTQCGECGSRNIVTVAGEPDKEAIAAFVRSRAARLGLNLSDYDIKIDRTSGAVTAHLKTTAEVDIDFI